MVYSLWYSVSMNGKIIDFKPRKIEELTKILFSLRKQEQDMKNPLLKEWFAIRNKIRALERKIKEMKNETID